MQRLRIACEIRVGAEFGIQRMSQAGCQAVQRMSCRRENHNRPIGCRRIPTQRGNKPGAHDGGFAAARSAYHGQEAGRRVLSICDASDEARNDSLASKEQVGVVFAEVAQALEGR